MQSFKGILKLKLLIPILLFCLYLILEGCSHSPPEGKTQAEVLYKEGKELIDKKNYQLANEKFNKLKSQHPYSYYATHAELLQADILFLQESYAEAAASYLVFKDFHPKYKDLPYVVWKIAESYYFQLPSTFDRDLSPAYEAIKYYEEIINSHRESEYVDKSRERIEAVEKLLMEKEKYIADFYFKTNVFDAAIYRYSNIIRNFKDQELLDHSILRVIESNINLENYSECLKSIEKLNDLASKKIEKKISKFSIICKEKAMRF